MSNHHKPRKVCEFFTSFQGKGRKIGTAGFTLRASWKKNLGMRTVELLDDYDFAVKAEVLKSLL